MHTINLDWIRCLKDYRGDVESNCICLRDLVESIKHMRKIMKVTFDRNLETGLFTFQS